MDPMKVKYFISICIINGALNVTRGSILMVYGGNKVLIVACKIGEKWHVTTRRMDVMSILSRIKTMYTFNFRGSDIWC